MKPGRGLRTALAVAAIATVAAGCGLGSGERSEGEATLTVTRDYGVKVMLEASEPEPSESETVIRMLDAEAEIATRYGGGFVHSIDGVSGEVSGGRSLDWFFFVNGIESSVGAAEVPVRGGDRIWWDYRDWTDAMRAPAVVGSWPEPFAQASADGGRVPVRIECRGAAAPCDEVAERLADAGVDATRPGRRERARRCACWLEPGRGCGSDPVATQLDDGPQASGVFARFERFRSGFRLLALDERAEVARAQASDAGLVAALRRGERAADLARHRHRRRRRRRCRRGARRRPARAPLRACGDARGRSSGCRPGGGPDEVADRLLAPPGPARRRRAPLAASVYLGSLAVVAFVCSNPIVLAGAGAAVVVAGLGCGRRSRARRRCALGGDPRRADRRRQRRSPPSAARRSSSAAGTCRCSARSTSAARRWSRARSSRCGSSSCWSPSPSTRPASTPTGCCACCGRSPATRR